jgi:hypothetical protein
MGLEKRGFDSSIKEEQGEAKDIEMQNNGDETCGLKWARNKSSINIFNT